MPRLFTGISIPGGVADRLAGMRYEISGIRWVDPLDYHITVRFIGEVAAANFNRIAESLSSLSRLPPFSLSISSLDVFGGAESRVLYAAVQLDQGLVDLYRLHESIMRDLEVSVEDREFVPHITLARISHWGAAEVERVMARYSGPLEIDFPVTGFALYSSDYNRQQRYVVEREYPFLG